jgi:hypothetical protein
MGTNYTLHLGKSVGGAEGPEFIWAVPAGGRPRPSILVPLDSCTVTNEYGKELTWGEFAEFVEKRIQNTTNVGTNFG